MELTASPQIDRDCCKDAPFGTVLVISIVFHLLVLVGLPLVTHLVWRQSKFERPKTFQLVRVPLPPNPTRKVPDAPKQQRVAQEQVRPEPRREPSKTPVAKKENTPAKQQEAAKPKEDLDELASLLNEIPAPAQASSTGEFPYPWYLRNMEQKVQRHWTPPSNNRTISVQVSFVVHRDGKTTDIRIRKTSGNSALDNLALRAVTLASPFGKMPPGFGGELNEFSMTLHPTTN